MKIRVNSELGYTELIIEEQKDYKEDYQMLMLRECNIEGLVPMMGRGVDESSQYIYDISGMKSIKQIYEKESMDEYSLRQFSKQLLVVLEMVKQHMLDVNKVLLNSEYIYKIGQKYYFCYYPLSQDQVKVKFHELSEFFVKVIDYKDIESVVLACDIHRSTMEEHYDLAQLLEQHIEVQELSYPVPNTQNHCKNKDNDLWEGNTEIQDREGESDHKSYAKKKAITNFIKETSLHKMWIRKPKDNLPPHKNHKEKWGDWEDIIRQENENSRL